jgi:hypothetical protein
MSYYLGKKEQTLSPAMLSTAGILTGNAGGGNAPAIAQDCPAGQHWDTKTKTCVDDAVDGGGDGGGITPGGDPACRAACDLAYRNAIARNPLDLRGAQKAKDNCYSVCDGGTGTTCTPPMIWDDLQKKCVNPDARCTPPAVWDDVQKKCVTTNPGRCTPPAVWDGTKCVTPGGNCGQGAGVAYTGCPECGKKYMAKPGEACGAGYVPVQKPEGIQCECQKWCVDAGWGEDCVTYKGTNPNPTPGSWEFPPELDALLKSLYGRANTFMGKKPGYSQGSLDSMFGVGYDRIRRAGTATNDATTAALQEQGMLGTGAGQGAIQANAWNTEQNVADLQREVFAAQEAQKRNDLTSFTESATRLFQAGLTAEQIKEAINSSRRGEGAQWTAMLLQYLLGMR